MPSYSKNDIVLVRYPFSALSGVKVRPAVIVHAPHVSQDIFLVPLTSRTTSLLAGEFVLAQWSAAGLHVPTAVKRGLYTVHETLILTRFPDALCDPFGYVLFQSESKFRNCTKSLSQ